ncbi:Hypothetical protein PENO1_102250 [Penicillium occitanis (nom. inval.)]|nr:Hypothetical protein PENO1_102250 [Penicillium occitanis (nom. inval.)]PCG90478.1 hypothetical protein PENOC_101840 [Penicillium occitanis (nom. inval.)]
MPTPSEDLGPTLIAVTTVLLVLSITFVALRCYVRLRLAWGFWWDDGFILLSLAFLIGSHGVVYYLVAQGLGKHTADLSDPISEIATLLDFLYDFTIVFVIGSYFNKISIGLFLRRLKFNSRWFIIPMWILMFLLGAINIAALAINVFNCDDHIINGSGGHVEVLCPTDADATPVVYTQSGLTIVLDLFLSISPIPVLWHTQLTCQQKIRVWGLIALGLISTVANALRNKYSYVLATYDQAYTLVVLIIISEMEFALGVIAACCPAIVPLFKRRQLRRSYHDIGGSPSNNSDRVAAGSRGERGVSGPSGWLEAAVGLESGTTMTTRSIKDNQKDDEEQQHHEQRLSDQNIYLLAKPKPAYRQQTYPDGENS